MQNKTENPDSIPISSHHQSVSVLTFGACGDGVHNDSPAIQAALSSRFRFITIPSGNYLLYATLRVPSHTVILCQPDTQLKLAAHPAPSRNRFLITNENHDHGNSDIQIDGGIWDGNAEENTRGPDHPDSYTGVLINFFNVESLRISNMQLSNPDSYHIRLCRVKNFQIHNIVCKNTAVRPNQDGVHIAGHCTNGLISSISGVGSRTPNDDLVALNADDNNDRAQNLGLENGPIRNIIISHLRAEDCHSFIRLLSTESPIENILIQDVEGGFREHAINMDAGRNCSIPVVSADDPRSRKPLGKLQSVSFQQFHVFNTLVSGKAYINLETACETLSVDCFTRNVEKEADAESATFEMKHVPACTLNIAGNATVESDSSECRELLRGRGGCSLAENSVLTVFSERIDSLLISQRETLSESDNG